MILERGTTMKKYWILMTSMSLMSTMAAQHAHAKKDLSEQARVRHTILQIQSLTAQHIITLPNGTTQASAEIPVQMQKYGPASLEHFKGHLTKGTIEVPRNTQFVSSTDGMCLLSMYTHGGKKLRSKLVVHKPLFTAWTLFSESSFGKEISARVTAKIDTTRRPNLGAQDPIWVACERAEAAFKKNHAR